LFKHFQVGVLINFISKFQQLFQSRRAVQPTPVPGAAFLFRWKQSFCEHVSQHLPGEIARVFSRSRPLGQFFLSRSSPTIGNAVKP
jgi:hypothetical protein